MATKNQLLITTFILPLAFFLAVTASAQQKVVVVPLFETVKEPIEPYSPLPDTLQTISYTTTFGEDSDYTRNPPSYTYYGDGTVTDNVTGLVWQQADDNVQRTWADAWNYCQNLELPAGGWTDWRLPSANELMSIVHYGTHNPAINSFAFPGTKSLSYWSATTFARISAHAWNVRFYYGIVQPSNKNNTLYVRCVR